MLTHFLTRYFVLAPLLSKSGLALVFPLSSFIMLSLSVVCISAAGYVINDYFDRKTDIINKPGRVIIGRYIKRRAAMFSHLVLNMVALFLGAYISFQIHIPELSLVFLVVIGILWFYSTTYKRQLLVGNLVVSFFAGLVPLMVLLFEVPPLKAHYGSILGLMGTNFAAVSAWIIGFSAFAFWTNLIREIIKDIEDMNGDMAFGRATLPITWGIKTTKAVIYILLAILVIAVFIINALFLNQLWAVIYSLIMVVIPLLYVGFLVFETENIKDFKKAGNWLKIIMLNGVLFAIPAKYLILG